jgi:hypothetical protein
MLLWPRKPFPRTGGVKKCAPVTQQPAVFLSEP